MNGRYQQTTGDKKVDALTNVWAKEQQKEKADAQSLVTDKFARITYIRDKKKNFQSYDTYFKPETKQRRAEFMEKIQSLKNRFSVIGPGKDWRDLINK
jgi:hypothetical protein|tara:strand:+ start:620 stop:913 length:294 start_codon:yes stop_codon:yes gene_type:complete